MRAAPAAVIVAVLVTLLTWFSYHAVNPRAELFDHALAELNRFGMIENALYRDVFAARAGMLRNYDPLVNEINGLHDSLQRLRGICIADAELLAATDWLAVSVDRQEELVEHFKTENALLQNSLSFFGRLGVNPTSSDLDPTISTTVAAILRLALDTSPSTVRDVQGRLDDLDLEAKRAGHSDSVETLLAHGRLLNRLLPSVDGTLKTMRALPQKRERDELHAMTLNQRAAARATARRFRILLYATSLVLVAFLVYLARRLKFHADVLERRAAYEHALTEISLRFINAPLQNIDAEIDHAIADMAACSGADRAYFVKSGPSPRLQLWHKPGMEPPPGWPERAPALARQVGDGADGIAHISRVRRMPVGEARTAFLELGLGGWVCVTRVGHDGATMTLGFDGVGRPCRGTRAELALLPVALDTIVRAVERQAMEKERARLEARLLQAQRMEQIGFFTSGIAHNFNNILGGILGHSEVMEEHVGSDAKVVRNLGAIRRSAERARDLVDQILVFGRRRDAGRKPLSIGALVAEAASLLDVSLPAGVELVIRQPPTAAIVSGEHAQLQQVLLNLCRNAVNAMQDQGRIEVSTELHEIPEPRQLSHDEIEPGPYVCIAVTDTGRGIDGATLARIFEPFFTTRPSGNGLGLATVREIVREHGGALNVQSKQGEGSRFEIWLPRASAAAPTSEPGTA